MVSYASMPASCALVFSHDSNYAGEYSDMTVVDDDERNVIYADAEGIEATTLQWKIAATVNSNDAPEIESAAAIMR